MIKTYLNQLYTLIKARSTAMASSNHCVSHDLRIKSCSFACCATCNMPPTKIMFIYVSHDLRLATSCATQMFSTFSRYAFNDLNRNLRPVGQYQNEQQHATCDLRKSQIASNMQAATGRMSILISDIHISKGRSGLKYMYVLLSNT